jgi:hypothetical protein
MTLDLTKDQEDLLNQLADKAGVSSRKRLDEIIRDEYYRSFRVVGPTGCEDPYWNDDRDFQYFNFCGNTIYRAYNMLTRYHMDNLLEEIDDELRVCEDKWDRSVEATNELSKRKLIHKTSWYTFFRLVKKHLYNYAEITKNPKVKEYKVQSYWAKRMKGTNPEDYNNELYINYRNTHSHENFDLGMIYYLNNPSRIYGTLIENGDREIIIPGDENSLLIHHSHINHQPVMPPPIVANKYYRCVIVVDFMHPSKT